MQQSSPASIARRSEAGRSAAHAEVRSTEQQEDLASSTPTAHAIAAQDGTSRAASATGAASAAASAAPQQAGRSEGAVRRADALGRDSSAAIADRIRSGVHPRGSTA
jgi:hypothetical protein